MELKKLHMGTMAYNIDTMDEIANQLDAALGKQQQGKGIHHVYKFILLISYNFKFNIDISNLRYTYTETISFYYFYFCYYGWKEP